jgi:hypothetical protein
MKTCLICLTPADADGESTCGSCGEASWSEPVAPPKAPGAGGKSKSQKKSTKTAEPATELRKPEEPSEPAGEMSDDGILAVLREETSEALVWARDDVELPEKVRLMAAEELTRRGT